VPALTRDNWEKHPNYPRQALLLGSHANFLRFTQALIDQSKGFSPPAARIGAEFERLLGALRGHEGYEESKLYPFLTRRFGLQVWPLEAGHTLLHNRADEVLVAVRNAPSSGPVPAVRRALEAYRQALVTHLRLEEDAVIPLLLKLPPAEFDRFAG